MGKESSGKARGRESALETGALRAWERKLTSTAKAVGWQSEGLHSVSGTIRRTLDTAIARRIAAYTETKIPAYKYRRKDRIGEDNDRPGRVPLLTDLKAITGAFRTIKQ